MWCASTETFIEPSAAHQSIKAFENGLVKNDENIAPSMIYAYASLMEGVPFANGAPNLTVDIPAMHELSKQNEAPICGKDFKTGQTLMKTVLAPAFKARLLGLSGWFSTNILGNRDGEVLDDPGSFKTKEESKLGVLEHILQPEIYPELYGNIFHKVRINYYPPRGDNKEGWDNIDIFGWLGYPMQIKVDFLCRDSILAAPHRSGPGAVPRFGKTQLGVARARHPGVAELLLQVADDGAGALSGARSVHSVDEAEEHAAPLEGRGIDHAPGAGILRLGKGINHEGHEGARRKAGRGPGLVMSARPSSCTRRIFLKSGRYRFSARSRALTGAICVARRRGRGSCGSSTASSRDPYGSEEER